MPGQAVLTLGNDDGRDTPVARNPDGAPVVKHEDVDRDGDLDLIVAFDAGALWANGDWSDRTTELALNGDFDNGEYIHSVAQVVATR